MKNDQKVGLKPCPICGSEPSVDFECHEIYCTGCPLSVRKVEWEFEKLKEFWNNLRNIYEKK